MSRVTRYEGVVESFVGGPGAGLPVLELATATGTVELVASPYRVLVRAGVLPAAGMRLAVTAAPAGVDDAEHWIVLSLRDLATGIEVALRDAVTGRPVAGPNGRGCGNN